MFGREIADIVCSIVVFSSHWGYNAGGRLLFQCFWDSPFWPWAYFTWSFSIFWGNFFSSYMSIITVGLFFIPAVKYLILKSCNMEILYAISKVIFSSGNYAMDWSGSSDSLIIRLYLLRGAFPVAVFFSKLVLFLALSSL